MSASNHDAKGLRPITPGPWVAFSNEAGVGVICMHADYLDTDGDGLDVAHCIVQADHDPPITRENAEAHALLIARAPSLQAEREELVEALTDAVEWLEEIVGYDGEDLATHSHHVREAAAKHRALLSKLSGGSV